MFIYFVVNYFCGLASPQKCLNTKYFSVRLMKMCSRLCTIHLTITFHGYHLDYCLVVSQCMFYRETDNAKVSLPAVPAAILLRLALPHF